MRYIIGEGSPDGLIVKIDGGFYFDTWDAVFKFIRQLDTLYRKIDQEEREEASE